MPGSRATTAEPTIFTMSAPARIVVSGTSAQLLAATDSRRYLSMFNTSAATTVYLAFGTNAAVVSNGLAIPAGAAYVMDRQGVSVQRINGIVASGTVSLAVQEGT